MNISDSPDYCPICFKLCSNDEQTQKCINSHKKNNLKEDKNSKEPQGETTLNNFFIKKEDKIKKARATDRKVLSGVIINYGDLKQ